MDIGIVSVGGRTGQKGGWVPEVDSAVEHSSGNDAHGGCAGSGGAPGDAAKSSGGFDITNECGRDSVTFGDVEVVEFQFSTVVIKADSTLFL